MTLGMVAEHRVAALLVSVAVWKLATNDGLDAFVWGSAILWFTAMALHFSANNRRAACGNRPLSRRAPIFDLALERLRRREAAVRFAWLLYALQVAFRSPGTRLRSVSGHSRSGRSSRTRRSCS
jgi:hypothetical protein